MLGPLLFVIFIDDLDIGINSRVSKFADDTKIFNSVGNVKGKETLQSDLLKLEDWCLKWQMEFNESKCKVLHFGNNNPLFSYTLRNEQISTSHTEKDLGVIISGNLKCASQVDKVVLTANRILGMINRSIVTKSKDIILPLYRTLVRPHLEYCIQAWRPYLKQDIDKLEKVQKRAVNMMTDVIAQSYNEKLKELKLFSLEKRRLRGDMIEVFKIMKGISQIDKNTFFSKLDTTTRGHSLKLSKPHCNRDCRKYFFSHRVISYWNTLPQGAIDCKTVESFKKQLDTHLSYLV